MPIITYFFTTFAKNLYLKPINLIKNKSIYGDQPK